MSCSHRFESSLASRERAAAAGNSHAEDVIHIDRWRVPPSSSSQRLAGTFNNTLLLIALTHRRNLVRMHGKVLSTWWPPAKHGSSICTGGVSPELSSITASGSPLANSNRWWLWAAWMWGKPARVSAVLFIYFTGTERHPDCEAPDVVTGCTHRLTSDLGYSHGENKADWDWGNCKWTTYIAVEFC